MNCKQGDLAIIIKSDYGYEGQIVTVIKWIDDFYQWEVDITGIDENGEFILSCDDCDLRPIRDSDKEDEMLSIVNLKEKVKA